MLLIEGRHAVEGAIKAGLGVEQLYLRDDAIELPDIYASHPLTVIRSEQMARLATTDSPPPILGVFKRPAAISPTALLSKQSKNTHPLPLWLLLDRVRDPGNLGTILRCAQSFGVTAIWLSEDCVDVEHPKVIRASAGIGFQLPTIHQRDFDWPLLLSNLATHQFQTGFTSSHGNKAKAHHLIDWKYPWAIMLGAEATGVRPEWSNELSTGITIPMSSKAESLNVALSAGIILSEAYQQRLNPLPSSGE